MNIINNFINYCWIKKLLFFSPFLFYLQRLEVDSREGMAWESEDLLPTSIIPRRCTSIGSETRCTSCDVRNLVTGDAILTHACSLVI